MSEWVREDGVYRARPLAALDWLEHGFGSRHAEGWAPSQHTVTVRQIHSDVVLRASEGPGCIGEGDALITDRPGVKLAIRTADCIPMLFVDRNRRAVAAVHAGWRGTASRIGPKTVTRMMTEFGSEPHRLEVAIGPGIGGCCYEVGMEVLEQLEDRGTNRKVDLTEINRQQLRAAGVSQDKIYTVKLCTRCLPEEFHSYRRDQAQAGRMVSAIGIR